SGVRRIEALTGRHAYAYMDGQLELLKQAAGALKSNVADVPKRIDALFAQVKELSRENESLQAKLGRIEAGSLESKAKTEGGVTVLASAVAAGGGMEALRGIADELKGKLDSAVIALGAVDGDKVNLVVSVSSDLVEKGIHAGKLIKEAAAVCGGGGGGRPDMAQAGGKDPSKLEEALQLVEELVLSQANVI
ncbi:DHHA1 domain-containing protein, partial [Paenibacillus darwinianus]